MQYSRYICHTFKLNVKLGGLRFNPKTLRSLRKNNKMTTWSLENVHISTMDLPRPMPGAPGSFGKTSSRRDPQRFKRTFRRCVETCHCNGHIWTKWLKSPCLLWNVSYFGGRFCFFFLGGGLFMDGMFLLICVQQVVDFQWIFFFFVGCTRLMLLLVRAVHRHFIRRGGEQVRVSNHLWSAYRILKILKYQQPNQKHIYCDA